MTTSEQLAVLLIGLGIITLLVSIYGAYLNFELGRAKGLAAKQDRLAHAAIEELQRRNGKLRRLIQLGHFRDSSTGRLGRKGQVPTELAERFGL